MMQDKEQTITETTDRKRSTLLRQLRSLAATLVFFGSAAPAVAFDEMDDAIGSGYVATESPSDEIRISDALTDAELNGDVAVIGSPFTAEDSQVFTNFTAEDIYHWEFLPRESLYPFYLADPKASRMAGYLVESTNDATLLDGTLGGRFGIFRYVNSTKGPFRRGLQVDFEGAAQVRLDLDQEHDVRSVDFRAGIPISLSFGRFQTRFGYYHLSSHVGDEFLIKNIGFNRLNYSRDVLFLGAAYWLDEATRVYAEMGWAFYSDVSEPWEFVFGIEEAPRYATGKRGAPFYAINGRLREEVDFGGGVSAQVGWAWRSAYDTGLLRLGLSYFNGKSNQFSFYNDHEELIGVGLWYDF